MTISEAIRNKKKKKIGLLHKLSIKFAEENLIDNEKVITAILTGTIKTKRETFPGVLVITDKSVFAVCGLLGIKRVVRIPIEDLKRCEENISIIRYKITFISNKISFSIFLNPQNGESFLPYVAKLNKEDFDNIEENKIFIPTFKRSSLLKKKNINRKNNDIIERQIKAAENFDNLNKKIL